MKKIMYLFVLILIMMLTGCGNDIRMKKAASDYAGMDYKAVQEEFKNMGFQNIEVKELDDLTSSSTLKDYQVGRVKINGIINYERKDKFPKDAEIIIEYHTIPKLKIPFSFEELSNIEFDELSKAFEEGQFKNINVSELYDLDPDEIKEESVITITINNSAAWNKNDMVPFDSEINITKHMPYEKYDAEVHIEFVGNLLLNKYNVDVFCNLDKVISMNHGEDNDFKIRYKKGIYMLKFQKSGDPSVSGSLNLDLSENKEASYKIYCYEDYVKVTEIYVRAAAKENETKVPISSKEFESMNYKNAQTLMENAEFNNIKTSIVYDIRSSTRDLENVASVSINGKTKFDKGDIFPKDALVIIFYHMKEEDDPVRIAKKQEEEARKEAERKQKEEEARIEAERQAEERKKAEEKAAKEAAARETLEKNVPQEMAKRAVIVAMTNCQATDVFKKDGNTYDEKKFHKYSDLGDMFVYVYKEGTWTAQSEYTWKVQGMIMGIYDAPALIKVDCYVVKADDTYKLLQVKKVMGAEEYLYTEEASKVNIEQMDASNKECPFLTVPSKLIDKDRDINKQTEILVAKVNHKEWVEKQFSIWDGSHKQFIELVKKQLNDEKSFKHKQTSYIEITDDDTLKLVNDSLKELKLKNRASKGDLLIYMDFTAKNAFNATIKSSAIAVAIEKDDSIVLLAIE